MPIVIAADNHVAREEQALDLVEEFPDRLVVGTPQKLVFEFSDRGVMLECQQRLINHRFQTEVHTLGGPKWARPETHYLHVLL